MEPKIIDEINIIEQLKAFGYKVEEYPQVPVIQKIQPSGEYRIAVKCLVTNDFVNMYSTDAIVAFKNIMRRLDKLQPEVLKTDASFVTVWRTQQGGSIVTGDTILRQLLVMGFKVNKTSSIAIIQENETEIIISVFCLISEETVVASGENAETAFRNLVQILANTQPRMRVGAIKQEIFKKKITFIQKYNLRPNTLIMSHSDFEMLELADEEFARRGYVSKEFDNMSILLSEDTYTPILAIR